MAKLKAILFHLALCVWGVGAMACGTTVDFSNPVPPNPSNPEESAGAALSPTFSSIQSNIFSPKCVSCHNSGNSNGGVNLESYDSLQASVSAHESHSSEGGHAILVAGNPNESTLYTQTQSGQMPKGGPKLSDAEVEAIRAWIQTGAANN